MDAYWIMIIIIMAIIMIHHDLLSFSHGFPMVSPFSHGKLAELPNGSAQKGPRNEHRLQGVAREAQGDAQGKGRQLAQGEDQQVARMAWRWR